MKIGLFISVNQDSPFFPTPSHVIAVSAKVITIYTCQLRKFQGQIWFCQI